MPTWTRITSPALPEFPAFAHAAVAGDHVYVSGMIGVKPDLSGVVEGGIGPETTQALRYAEHVLAACDATLADVVKVGVAMVDLGEWDVMNAAYLDVFGARTPARIAIGCASLLFGARVEFDAIAYLPR
jgi:enamine deaminase RidA (YjgF/YER057c/UK114 family)